MKLSIITINYNNLEGLQRTIDSVVNQTWRDFEWIVIDGGSTDGSKELLEKYQDHFSYWCSEPDKGIYNAMNKGIDHAKGEYCLFLNSGDWLESNNVIEHVFPYLNDADIYVGNMYYENKIGKSCTKADNFTAQNILNTLLFKGIPHPSSFIKRKFLHNLGNYREDMRIVSDWWFFLQSLIKGAKMDYIPVVVSVFNEDGISSVDKEKDIAERNKLLSENISLCQLVSFYYNNYDIVKALRSNSYTFFIFRIYFFFYRKFHK